MTPVFPMNTNGNLGTESVIGQAPGLSLPVSLSENSETLGEVICNLPDDEPLIEILTEISVKTCRNGSRVGEIEPLEKAAQTALNAASRLELSQSGDSETLVEVAGIEPAREGDSTPANKRDSEFSVEALTEILTEISGTDRQMLTQIVKRWGSLSDELKRAVLRVVG